MPNIESLLRDHVTLQVECIDRIFLHGYVSALQRPGQLVWFLTQHLKKPFASPALLKQLTDRFVQSIKTFARDHRIPIVHFDPHERKDDVAHHFLARFKKPEGLMFIGVAQEPDKPFRSVREQARDGRWPRAEHEHGF
jgi:hypothetical protein